MQEPPKGAHVCDDPQVPLVVPGTRLHTDPEQHSSTVHVPPSGTQDATQVEVSVSQFPEQHWPPAEQVVLFGAHETHSRPVPVSRQSSLQQVASVAHVPPVAVQEVVCSPQLNPVLLPASSMQVFGAQQERSSPPLHWPPVAVQVETAAVQWRTPVASGTQGAPLQH